MKTHESAASFTVRIRRVRKEPERFALAIIPPAGLGLSQTCCDEGHPDVDSASLHGCMVLYKVLSPPKEHLTVVVKAV